MLNDIRFVYTGGYCLLERYISDVEVEEFAEKHKYNYNYAKASHIASFGITRRPVFGRRKKPKEKAETKFSRQILVKIKSDNPLAVYSKRGILMLTRTGRPFAENVDKITEIFKVDRHVSCRSITQELKIDHKTVLNHLRKVGFKKNLDVLVPHQLTSKNMMDRVSICEALAKRIEIDPFLKRIVTGDEKWAT
ncbi:histone-lysine N-methyltransferase SETMAR [Trichonephila clavipes]|nr:histone-lysine N-methyltransferase SETMAR [Trichonephila clavipes]